jgi:hypothetical protein
MNCKVTVGTHIHAAHTSLPIRVLHPSETLSYEGPPLWSSDQSSWLQIQRSGFDSRHYQEKKVMGLERGPLSLVSTTEELLDRIVAAPIYKTENTVVGIRCADHATPSFSKSWH